MWGIPIILEAIIGLVTVFDIKADVLVSLALIASVCIGEDFAAGEVAFIMQLGSLLEDMTVARAKAGIEKLVHLTPQTARVIVGDVEKIVPVKEVKVGDILRVQPEETVPMDGVVLSGQTSINQAVMTGKSLPIDKSAGDDVSSGTINQYGAFEMKAVKAKIVGLADRWATWIVVIALTAAALTWLISGEIIRAVTILVVFCPCALMLATPMAIMAAIGNATKHGFLVRDGDALERLAGVKRIDRDADLRNAGCDRSKDIFFLPRSGFIYGNGLSRAFIRTPARERQSSRAIKKNPGEMPDVRRISPCYRGSALMQRIESRS